MCGFAGFLRLKPTTATKNDRLEVLRRMSLQLALRGPDDEQFYDDGTMALVFRRLSIIDLDHGRQPIWNEDNTIWACVNGEIYNHPELRAEIEGRHQFRTRSDSESVLHLYEDLGSKALDKLNGMFAVVIWDTVKQELLLARDRLGIKPLYYAVTDDYLLFGSELKALLAHPACPRTIDWHDVRAHYNTTLTHPTFVEHIRQLPGGCHATITPGRELKQQAWWSIEYKPGAHNSTRMNMEEYVERCHSLFINSVHQHMRSDVPVGIFLSGGFDSSLLAAVAAQTSPDLHCFCIDNSITQRVGDVDQAEKVAKRFSLPLHKVEFPLDRWLGATDFNLNTLEYFVWLMDSPRFRWEWVFKHELHRYAKTINPNMKVILLGQGADEFTGGYSSQYHAKYPEWNTFAASTRGRIKNERLHDKGIHWPFTALLNNSYLGEIMNEHHQGGWRAMAHHSAIHLQYYNLWHEDRASSGQSMEARVPFLDHRLVEHMLNIDPAWCAELLYNKEILRRLMDKLMPDYPREKIKVAFLQTGELNEANQLDVTMVKKIFPAFRERYLKIPDSVFSEPALSRLFQNCFSGSQANYLNIRCLMSCMCISIFERWCRQGSLTGRPEPQLPPSRLREC
jgi:asparagine synthase (glutamine-hydrolysing)